MIALHPEKNFARELPVLAAIKRVSPVGGPITGQPFTIGKDYGDAIGLRATATDWSQRNGECGLNRPHSE